MQAESFDGLDKEELLELRDRLVAQIRELAETIRILSKSSSVNRAAMAIWRRERMQKGLSLSRVEHALKQLKEEEKAARRQTVEARFLELAMRALPEEVSRPLLDQAKQEADDGVWAID